MKASVCGTAEAVAISSSRNKLVLRDLKNEYVNTMILNTRMLWLDRCLDKENSYLNTNLYGRE